jgi:RecB family exonuclease
VGDWLATSAIRDPANTAPVIGAEWDRISRAARISGGIDRWNSQLERYARALRFRADQLEQQGDDAESGDSRRADRLRHELNRANALLGFITSLSDELVHPERCSWTEWTEWVKSLVGRYFDGPATGPGGGSTESVLTLLDRIGELDDLTPDGQGHKPDLDHFISVTLRGLSDSRHGQQGLGRGVFVGSLRDAAGTQFEQVHILGMADGSFPSQDSADPLLPDDVRGKINGICGTRLTLASDRTAASRREFHVALRSGAHATLYWSRSSSQGSDDVGPAQWLVEQARTRPESELVQAGDLLKRPDSVPGLSLVEYGTGAIAADHHEYEFGSVKRHVESRLTGLPHLLEQDDVSGIPAALQMEQGRYGSRDAPSISPWSGDVSGASEHLPVISGEVLSASRVETYATCPLRYFFAYVLGIDPLPPVEDHFHLPADRKGLLVHSVLELYLNLCLGDSRPPGKQTLDEAMQTATDRWLQNDPDAAGRVWEIEIGEIRRQLSRWLVREHELEAKGYAPSDAELSFGRPGWEDGPGLPPLEHTLDDGVVLRFTGVIDRVDRRGDDQFYVYDYKTGTRDTYSGIDKDPVDRGRHLQLALYSKAVEQFRPAKNPPGAAYWFVLEGKQRLRPELGSFDAPVASDRLSSVLEVLRSSNSKGHFPPNPGSRPPENCRYCDFDSVCPSGSLRERMRIGHATDGKLASYFDLADARTGEER